MTCYHVKATGHAFQVWPLPFLVSRWGWNCAPNSGVEHVSRPEGCDLKAEGLWALPRILHALWMHHVINLFPMGPYFMCSCVLLSPGRFGPLRAEVVVGFRRVRLVQALLSSPSSAGLVPFSVGLRFSFPLPFQGCPFWARFHVLVFALSLFFCVPLFASWLSNFHLIVIFTPSSFPFLFIFISLSGP